MKARRAAHRIAQGDPEIFCQIMTIYLLGIGRTPADVERALSDLRRAGRGRVAGSGQRA